MSSSFSSVCTLFEGHYHYGLAVLVNSLGANNFSGNIYAGYKGKLPLWAQKAKDNPLLEWDGASTMMISKDLRLHFLPVITDMHLANYKPHFTLSLRRFTDKGLIYFDPDIVVKCEWNFFEEWITFGVAVVQDVISNNFSPAHPRRIKYKAVIEKAGKKTERNLYNVFNSGFCGISIANFEFAETWKKIINTAVEYFGYNPDYFTKTSKHTNIFSAGDQDAFNMALMCCQSPISDVGPEGMDFIHGGRLMSHATGNPKPWNKNFLLSAINGVPPSLADRAYWLNAAGLIKTHNAAYIKFKKLTIMFSAFIGRFYKKA